MDKRSIIQKLQLHESELKAAGVLHLRLFGSVARGDSGSHSDIDLVVEMDPARRLTLLQLVRLENRLSDLLGAKVDLSLQHSMKETVRNRALREAIHAF